MTMIKLTLLLLISFFSVSLTAQTQKANSINSCSGAINIFENNLYQLQFTGKKNSPSIAAYKSLETIGQGNQLWVSYVAGSAGELNFSANVKKDFVQMVIFQELANKMCSEITSGVAEIVRLHSKRENQSIGLSKSTGSGFLYSLSLQKSDKINILFSSSEKNNNHLELDWIFLPKQVIKVESKILDRRDDDFAPTFSIVVRDKSNNNPLIASIAITNSKNLDGLYTASDVYLNIDRKNEFQIKCDVEGFFFKDTTIMASSFDDQEVFFSLERIAKGLSVKIEDIEFKPGSSIITINSEPKLNRLKDFLLLNSDISIEIQGHVFALGDNSLAGQKISEARAKRVKKFLIEHGVNKNRLKSKGYGNTKPIYEDPKFSYEEQANRRVEILVL